MLPALFLVKVKQSINISAFGMQEQLGIAMAGPFPRDLGIWQDSLGAHDPPWTLFHIAHRANHSQSTGKLLESNPHLFFLWTESENCLALQPEGLREWSPQLELFPPTATLKLWLSGAALFEKVCDCKQGI